MSSTATHRFSSLDGTIVETSRADLPVPGMTASPERSVFTTVKIRNGRPVFFDDHISRLLASARESRILERLDRNRIHDHCAALIAANAVADCAMRIVLYAETGSVHEVLQTRDTGYAPEKHVEGFRLMTVFRDPVPNPALGHKTLDYRANLDALASARAGGCDEALFVNSNGEAWECAVCNIFAVKDGRVRTPSATGGVLPGIIRGRLLTGPMGFQIREGPLPLTFLTEADEVFVTNSLLGIMPVSAIDDHVFRLDTCSVTAALRAVLARWECEESGPSKGPGAGSST